MSLPGVCGRGLPPMGLGERWLLWASLNSWHLGYRTWSPELWLPRAAGAAVGLGILVLLGGQCPNLVSPQPWTPPRTPARRLSAVTTRYASPKATSGPCASAARNWSTGEWQEPQRGLFCSEGGAPRPPPYILGTYCWKTHRSQVSDSEQDQVLIVSEGQGTQDWSYWFGWFWLRVCDKRGWLSLWGPDGHQHCGQEKTWSLKELEGNRFPPWEIFWFCFGVRRLRRGYLCKFEFQSSTETQRKLGLEWPPSHLSPGCCWEVWVVWISSYQKPP